jgi:hypothetical protein
LNCHETILVLPFPLASMLHLPSYSITGASLLGCVVVAFAQGVRSRTRLAEVFAALWLGLAVLHCAWAVLIYPHHVSPLRHLPTAKGSHWLFGHGKLFATGQDEPTRKW